MGETLDNIAEAIEELEGGDDDGEHMVETLDNIAEEIEDLEGEVGDEEELVDIAEDVEELEWEETKELEGLEGKDGGEVQVKTLEGIAEEVQDLEGEDGDEEELVEALEEIEEEIEELKGEDGSAAVAETLVPAATELSPPLLKGADAVPPSVAAAAAIVAEPTGLTKLHRAALLSCAVVAMAAFALVMNNIKGSKKQELDVVRIVNLRGSPRYGGSVAPMPTKGLRGKRRRASISDQFDDVNLPLEVRNSASGGWHCVYDVDQIDFRALGHVSNHGEDGATNQDDVENSPFMADELEEIESGVKDYSDINLDDQSDEDLIRAYNEALALDVEPESEAVNFVMQSFGSDTPMQEDTPTIQ